MKANSHPLIQRLCGFLVILALGRGGLGAEASYDHAGRLTRMSQRGGSQVNYAYDSAGNITSVSWTTAADAAPALTSDSVLPGEAGVYFEKTLVANKPGVVFGASGLPAGVALKGNVLSGTPAAAGVSMVALTLTAGNQSGASTLWLEIRAAAQISWPAFAGNYAGSAETQDGEGAGAASFKVTKTGTFTGTAVYEGHKLALVGAFSADGTFSKVVAGPDGKSLQVDLAYSRLDESVSGTISDGNAPAIVEARRLRANGEVETWQIGTWNFALYPTADAPAEAPAGDGYGMLKVAKTGRGGVAGALPDGTKFSGSVILGKENEAALFSSLYAGKGLLSGDLSIEGAPVVSGRFAWSHPARPKDAHFKAAFVAPLEIIGSRFAARPAGQRLLDLAVGVNNAQIRIGTETLADPILELFTIGTNNRGVFAAPNSEKLTFGISTAGVFSGSFFDQTSRTTRQFHGLILQEQRAGAGYFLGVPASGAVELEANP